MDEESSSAEQPEEIHSVTSARFTRGFQTTNKPDLPRRQPDCCFTAIQFAKVYPGDMTVTLTTPDGRMVTRRFTSSKTVRTAFISKKADDEDEDSVADIVSGGMGSCVDVDVSITDTSSAALAVVHYQFRLCCDDKKVHPGTVLTFIEPNPLPGAQVAKLPLLQIKAIKRAPCPPD